MTPLRLRMTEDMRLAGLAAGSARHHRSIRPLILYRRERPADSSEPFTTIARRAEKGLAFRSASSIVGRQTRRA
jgi:hypothetical protein